jgi:serine/threonine protein kinase
LTQINEIIEEKHKDTDLNKDKNINNINNINPKNSFKNKIDDYSIGKEIGKGAYAIVKSAIHKPTNKKFAIKFYEKVKLLDPEKKASVKREIQILKKIDSHENIVKLIEVIETNRQVS